MPVQTRREGDNVLVDSVDLKRSARNVLRLTQEPGWTPPTDVNQAMDFMARAFGYPNLHAALNSAAALAPASTAAPKSVEPFSLDEEVSTALQSGVPFKMQASIQAMSSEELKGLMGFPSGALTQDQMAWAFDELERHLGVGPSRTIVGLVGGVYSGRSAWVEWASSLPGVGVDFTPPGEGELTRLLARQQPVVLVDGFCNKGSTLDDAFAGMVVESHLRSRTRLVFMADDAEDVVRNFRLPRVDKRVLPIKLRIVDFNRRSSYEIEMAGATVVETFSHMPTVGVNSGFRTAEQNDAIQTASPRRRARP
ncbi:hypothetical protein ABIC83_002496 [Roseateles asaccharophilus]|uniref:hypothetical protein n=1 Tax=Roseateles asaccharophilus TaxID=582607 RepID=UPI003839BDBC